METRIWPYVVRTMLMASIAFIPSPALGSEDPWKILDDFTPVPRTLTRIGDHYVAMLFVQREQELMAAVIFHASCGPAHCDLHQRAGYAVANSEGSNTRLYVEPGETALIELIGAIYAQHSGRYG